MSSAKDVDKYLASVPAEAREVLEKMRSTIKATAPKAAEAISYQMPAFKLNGKGLVAYAAFKNHYSLFPMSAALIDAHQEELKAYKTSKGTIQFSFDKPMPVALIKKLVKARVNELCGSATSASS